ncbi:MAG: T9SS type A sorting domain-containing protein [Saprospiraceae bacterium]|nr:T9SS type A sorting domain-containing protein [Saprospiraceae bacterium]
MENIIKKFFIGLIFLCLIVHNSQSQSCADFVIKPPSNITSSSVQLNWSHVWPTFVLKWDIEFKQGSNPIPNLANPTYQSINNLDTTFVINSLQPNTTYKFWIRATCWDGVQIWKTGTVFTTALTNPYPSDGTCSNNIGTINDNNCSFAYKTFLIDVAPESGTLNVDKYLDEVDLIIQHDWLTDLRAKLVAPNGSTIQLFSEPGIPGNSNLGDPTTCTPLRLKSNYACSLNNIANSSAPFVGQYYPLEPFESLSGSVNGVWKLQLCDDAIGNIGYLKQVQLKFKPLVCKIPLSLTSNNIGFDSADLSWQSTSDCQNTIIEYGPQGFTPNTDGTASSGSSIIFVNCSTSQPYHLSNLNELTTYDVYVRSACVNGYSENSCKTTFTTSCDVLAQTMLEDFEDQLPCSNVCSATCPIWGTWFNASNDDMEWVVFEGPTPTQSSNQSTGPSTGVGGAGKYIYIETSDINCQSNKKAILQSNCIDIHADQKNCHLSFYYHAFGNNINRLDLQISSDGGNVWTNVWGVAGNQGNEWKKQFIDLSSYDNTTVVLRFVAQSGDGANGDIAIDNIVFYGSADAGFSNALYYKDEDNDGFGNVNAAKYFCTNVNPSGYVSNFTDCDDSNPSMHPNATEIICNQIDENCNGYADDKLLISPTMPDLSICRDADLLLYPNIVPIGELYWREVNDLYPASSGDTYFIQNAYIDGQIAVKDSVYDEANIKITKIDLDTPDRIELQNFSSSSIAMSNWKLIFSQDFNNINSYNATVLNLNTVLNSDQIINFSDDSNNANFVGTDIAWEEDKKGWAMLLNSNNEVIDAVFWGWSSEEIRRINFQYGTTNITKSKIKWSGNGITNQLCTVGSLSIELTNQEISYTSNDYSTCGNGVFGQPIVQDVAYTCSSLEYFFNVNTIESPQLEFIPQDSICQRTLTNLNNYVTDTIGNSSFSFYSNQSPITYLYHPNYQEIVTVVAEGVNQCKDTLNFLVPIFTPPTVTIFPNQDEIFLCDNSSALFYITHDASTAPYRYYWSDGTQNDTLNLVVNNSLDNQFIVFQVQDAHLCSEKDSVLIHVNPAIDINNVDVNDATTCIGNDGSIVITPSDQLRTFAYSWSGNSTGSATNVVGTFTINNLIQGEYYITITDQFSSSCNAILGPYYVNSPTAQILNVNVQNVSCKYRADGAITLLLNAINPTFLWSNGMTTQNIANIPAGSYSVTVSEGFCQNTISNILVSEPNELIISNSSIVDVSCNGSNDGQIYVNTLGGTPPYSYQWNIGTIDSNYISSLSSGYYHLSITDAHGCKLLSGFTINEPAALEVIVDSIYLNICPSSSEGFIDIHATGGSGNYVYTWSDGAQGQIRTDLSQGTYAVTITDAHQCTKTISFTVNEISPIIINANIQEETCENFNDAAIQLSLSGGEQPYQCLWSNNDTSLALSNLIPDTYSVTISDAHGCSINRTFTLTQATMQVLTTKHDALCVGADNGVIALNVIGAHSPLQIQWNDNNDSNQLTRDSLGEGTYAATITDNLGCVLSTENIQILAPQLISLVNSSTTDAQCFNNPKGIITQEYDGGLPPYHFEWNNNLPDEQNLFNLSGGFYQCTVSDQLGCSVVSPNYFIGTPSQLQVAALNSSPASCADRADGNLDILVIGGELPYTYNWSNGSTSQDLNNVFAGTYQLVLIDSNNCVVQREFEITSPPLLFAYASNVSADICSQNNGAIFVNVEGGTPDYQYNWSNGLSSQNINNATSGVYELTVTDANNCKFEQNFYINSVNSQLTVDNLYSKDISCKGGNDGIIVASCENGRPPLRFNWSYGVENTTLNSTDTLRNLDGNQYNVTVTDANGCVGVMENVVIFEPQQMVIGLMDINPANCENSCDGSIQVHVYGGTGQKTYYWNGASGDSTLVDVCNGQYFLNVIDENGCIEQSNYLVTSRSMLDANFSTINSNCYNHQSGSVNIDVVNGIFPYHFQWSNGMTTEDIAQQPAGNYQVTIVDSLGCTVMLDSIIIDNPTPISIDSIYFIYPTSSNSSDGVITVLLQGGVLPYHFQWSQNANFQQTATAYQLSYGTYAVTVSDGNDCEYSFSIELKDVVSTDEVTVDNKVNVYPNPFSDIITVTISDDAYTCDNIALYNLQGQLIKNFDFKNKQISQLDLGEFSSGIYVLSLKMNNGDILVKRIYKK